FEWFQRYPLLLFSSFLPSFPFHQRADLTQFSIMMLRSPMLSSSSFLNPIPLNPPLSIIPRHHIPPLLLPLSNSSISLSKSHICLASSSSSNSTSSSNASDRDALLWLREEQRWLREEQRWLREEQRWFRERDSLLTEIHSLKLRIQSLEERISVSGTDGVSEAAGANVAPLLQVLKERSLIPESGSSANPIVLEETKEEEKEAEEPEPALVVDVRREDKVRKALKMGSEGEEVREMQVCSLTSHNTSLMHFF
ncbi:Protein disulfide isomerase pTAC5, chloroplastic, partial [Linum perenne]